MPLGTTAPSPLENLVLDYLVQYFTLKECKRENTHSTILLHDETTHAPTHTYTHTQIYSGLVGRVC